MRTSWGRHGWGHTLTSAGSEEPYLAHACCLAVKGFRDWMHRLLWPSHFRLRLQGVVLTQHRHSVGVASSLHRTSEQVTNTQGSKMDSTVAHQQHDYRAHSTTYLLLVHHYKLGHALHRLV